PAATCVAAHNHPCTATSARQERTRMKATTDHQIDAEQFFASEIRVGRIMTAEDFPEARTPAYKIQVDFGPAGTLHTSAQITHYPLDSLPGRRIVGVVNLKPNRIAGLTSQFLLLGSYDTDGTVRLLSPEPDASPGDLVG